MHSTHGADYDSEGGTRRIDTAKLGQEQPKAFFDTGAHGMPTLAMRAERRRGAGSTT